MKKQLAAHFWRLFKGYWNSEEKWRARGLLAVVVSLNFAAVYMTVLLNQWHNTFYNALQEYRYQDFWQLIGNFCLLAVGFIVFRVYAIYLNQMLLIRWRRWMTDQYLEKWLHLQTYYKMEAIERQTDNPDQRISEDIRQFVALTLQLFVNGLMQLSTLAAFAAVLWQLSGVITLPVAGGEIKIYGYMLWLTILYAGVGSYLTLKVGRPLIGLNFDQQRYEADFRYSMVRLRENSESVAFYHGEGAERQRFGARFAQVVKNYFGLMKYQKRLTWFVSGYAQIAIIVPILLAAPQYFARHLQLGGLMQTIMAFGKVQDALSYFITAYDDIAQWTAVVKRLGGFAEHMHQVEARAPQVTVRESEADALRTERLTVALPDGRVLLRNLALTLTAGDRLLVTGASGCGKSTLLRTLAGIWPYGGGAVDVPPGRRLFLPQRPYLPLGSLRQALFYPSESAVADDARVREILRACALESLADALDTEDEWSKILSLGEQQRIGFARLLLLRPQWAFLDEATSALDEATEERLYRIAAEALPDTAFVSVGHRSTLLRYHCRRLELGGGDWRLEALE